MKLPIVLIEAHSRCNCRCTMCDIWKTTEAREFTREQLEAQLPAFERLGTKRVVFTGGEPLMHSDIFALSAPLRERGIQVTLLSTGLLFERFAEQIVGSFDDAIVSLDGPREVHDRIRGTAGAFEKLARGKQQIYQTNPSFPISSRCVVQRLNHDQLIETAHCARSLGLNSISFFAADVKPGAFKRTQERGDLAPAVNQLPALDEQLRALMDEPFVSDSPRHLLRIGEHFRAYWGLAAARAPRCNAPWVSAAMGVDGRVKPCFFQPSYTETGALDAILQSPASRAWRAGLDVAANEICRNCVCSLYLEHEEYDRTLR